MGLYINPENCTKEEWLEKNGTQLTNWRWPPQEGHCLVCLVDNLMFTAAGVMFNSTEFDEFNNPRDKRSKKWYSVPEELVREVVGNELFGLYFKEAS
jgi:hypothetical protein